MIEFFTIRHNRLLSTADLEGFRDVLFAELMRQGSAPEITLIPTDAEDIGGAAIQVDWKGKIDFTSPDVSQRFTEERQFSLGGVELNYAFLLHLMGARARQLSITYRNTLRGMWKMAKALEDGTLFPGAMTEIEYLRHTLEEALNAYPNSN